MMILLTVSDWLHGHGVNIVCSKITRVSVGDCWNVFGSLDYCWLLIQILFMIILGDSW